MEVAITDGRKRNYREVERIDPGPAFEPMIDHRACGQDQAGSEEQGPVLAIAKEAQYGAEQEH